MFDRRMRRHHAFAAMGALLLGLVLGGSGALAQDEVSGAASVVDADIVMVDKQRVILWGVDAPERSQKCAVGSLEWGCYAESRATLGRLIGTGQASCVLTDDPPDPFSRRYGVCTSDGKDIGAEMVRLGMARAFTQQASDYVAQEEEARAAKRGIFQENARVDDPWVWRMRNPGGFR